MMEVQRKRATRVSCIAVLLVAVAAVTFGQESSGESTQVTDQNGVGFGLQSSIFTYVQNTQVDLTRNLTDAAKYRMTPGDIYRLTLVYGLSADQTSQQNAVIFDIPLGENRTLNVPVLGEVDVDQFNLLTLQDYVSTQLKTMLPLQHVSLSLIQPALFNVFVYGNVIRPGFITVNPTFRITDAIALSGGFKSDGSYRSIRLERGEDRLTLDISLFYRAADFGANPTLRPGDVVFVPSAQTVVTIEGETRYPGTYELIETENLGDVIDLAGGLLPAAERGSIDLVRITEDGRPLTIRVDSSEYGTFPMRNGDVVRVRSTIDNLNRVAVEGAIWGRRVTGTDAASVPTASVRLDLPFYSSMTVLDVLEEVGGPTPYAEPNSAYIDRTNGSDRIPVDVEDLWRTRDPKNDATLKPGDTIVIPMQKLSVFVTGMVVDPGAVPYQPGYTANDYVLLAGGYDAQRANPNALFTVDEDGRRKSIDRQDILQRGTTLFVGRKLLFFVDDNVQNFLIGAAWITSTITVVNAIIGFVNLLFPAQGSSP